MFIVKGYRFCERVLLNKRASNDKDLLKKTVKSFEAYLSVELQLGEVTIEGYLKIINKFLRDTGCVFPTRDMIITWLAAMRKDKVSYSHIRNTSNCFIHFMRFRGVDDFKLKPPKRPKRIIKDVMSEEEIRWLINATCNIKDKSFIVFLAYTGCRIKEVKNMIVRDLDFRNNELLVRAGKGDKDRNVCISAEALNVIRQYIKEAGKGPDDSLFHSGLSRKYIMRVLNGATAVAQVNKRVYPHLFRHSLATNMLNNGASILTIQNQLGHSTIKSTLIYLNFSREIFKKQYDRYKPDYLGTERLKVLPQRDTYEIIDERGTIYSGDESKIMGIWQNWERHSDVDIKGHVKLVKVMGVKQEKDSRDADLGVPTQMDGMVSG